jgi:hypothetical protein
LGFLLDLVVAEGAGFDADAALGERLDDVLPATEQRDRSVDQQQDLVDMLQRRSAVSPALSRFELGSSSTTRRGLPKKARASAMRCFWPPDRGVPSAATMVS